MWVKKVNIDIFKRLRNISISPKAINVIIGKNNVGKTSLLEAIYYSVAKETLSIIKRNYRTKWDMTKTYDKVFALANVHNEKVKVDIGLSDKEKKYFHLYKLKKEECLEEFRKYVISCIEETVKGKIPQRYNILHKTLLKKNKADVSIKKAKQIIKDIIANEKIKPKAIRIEKSNYEKTIFRYSEKILESSLKSLGEINGKILYYMERKNNIEKEIIGKNEKREIFFIKDLEKYRVRLLYSGVPKSRINKIEKYLKQRYFKNLVRFGFDDILFEDETGKEYEISFSHMGDGFQSLVILVDILNKIGGDEKKVLLIEEPENHMHPAYIRELLKLIIDFSKEKKIQFFISTHLDLLEFLFDEELNPDPKYQNYLDKEMNLIRMNELESDIIVEEISRKEGSEQLKKIHMDLRGLSS